MSTLLLDMDGPLADFDRHFWDRCIARGYTFDVGHHHHQRHRYFTEHLPIRGERKAARAMVDAPGWFADLPVTPGAIEGVAALLAAGLDVWVCTKPLEANPTCLNDKQAWLAHHFPALHGRLITAPDKSMIRGDVLIDDAPKPEWTARASWRPVIFDAPYNREGTPWEHLPRFRWGDVDMWVRTYERERDRQAGLRCPRCAGGVQVIDVPTPADPYAVLVQCDPESSCGWSKLVTSTAAPQ